MKSHGSIMSQCHGSLFDSSKKEKQERKKRGKVLMGKVDS